MESLLTMISNSTKKKQVNPKHSCEFCNRAFIREQSLLAHVCEYKFRWQERDKRPNQIAFQCWLDFYRKNSTPKTRTFLDFIKSPYYTAFLKFSSYCIDIKVVDVLRYCDWLLENKISVDKWAQDSNYDKFLIHHLSVENQLDAIARSIETTMRLGEKDGIQAKDCFRYGNRNLICYEVTKGKISPWMLYHSESGFKFLETLEEPLQNLIYDYINPEKWMIKFKRYPDQVEEVKQLLKQAGY